MKKNKKNDETLKEIEKAIYAIKFYPVAVDEQAKDDAMKKIVSIYNSGEDTVRQMVLYMIHENLAKHAEFKITHSYDYFKHKSPTHDPAQLRMNVYRAMFNYNNSLEGVIDMVRMVGEFRGDDAAKLLTYHYSRACIHESELNNTLKAVIIETLGKCESRYALRTLLEYARYCENERTINRIVAALIEWEERIEKMKIKAKEREKLRKKLHEVITKEVGGTHYG